jgi:hypothetical protein
LAAIHVMIGINDIHLFIKIYILNQYISRSCVGFNLAPPEIQPRSNKSSFNDILKRTKKKKTYSLLKPLFKWVFKFNINIFEIRIFFDKILKRTQFD